MPRGNKIQIRQGTGVPSAADFVTGEPAFDATAGALYIKNGAGVMANVDSKSASDLTQGTLADARLSANVPLLPEMLSRWSHPSTSVETTFRHEAMTNAIPPSSGNVLLTFFTPLVTLTVSQILMSSGAVASSGLTLARMGLYLATESAVTLVARTASDTTLFAAQNTQYARSFSTVGSFPATYTLVAGTRYAVGVLQVGTTPAQLTGKFCQIGVASLAPRVTAAAFGQSDLATLSSFSVNAAIVYARLS